MSLHLVAALMFFSIGLSSDSGAVAVMSRFSVYLGLLGAATYLCAPDRWRLPSVSVVFFALLIHPAMAGAEGFELAVLVDLFICVAVGALLAYLYDDLNTLRALHFWRKWSSATLALIAGCGNFIYWYGSPYELEAVRVLSISMSFFAIALLIAPRESGEGGGAANGLHMRA